MELKDNPELVERFRRGDREVLTELYRAHVDEVRSVLERGFSFSSKGQSIRFRGYREPFQLQEVLQEVFVHAFREKARLAYQPSLPYRPFLVTIARNWVIDRYRKERTEAALFIAIGDLAADTESFDDAMDRHGVRYGEATPEQQAHQQQLSRVLQEFVEALDEEDSRVLTEHLMGDLTQQEVADLLGTDRNEIRKRIRIMRERLLRHLKRTGFIGSLDPAEVFDRG